MELEERLSVQGLLNPHPLSLELQRLDPLYSEHHRLKLKTRALEARHLNSEHHSLRAKGSLGSSPLKLLRIPHYSVNLQPSQDSSNRPVFSELKISLQVVSLARLKIIFNQQQEDFLASHLRNQQQEVSLEARLSSRLLVDFLANRPSSQLLEEAFSVAQLQIQLLVVVLSKGGFSAPCRPLSQLILKALC